MRQIGKQEPAFNRTPSRSPPPSPRLGPAAKPPEVVIVPESENESAAAVDVAPEFWEEPPGLETEWKQVGFAEDKDEVRPFHPTDRVAGANAR